MSTDLTPLMRRALVIYDDRVPTSPGINWIESSTFRALVRRGLIRLKGVTILDGVDLTEAGREAARRIGDDGETISDAEIVSEWNGDGK